MTVRIDGRHGEGGGQILRTALTMSMCTGKPIHLTNIRAGRRKPGLMRQHLAAVLAAGKVCAGVIEGATLGSTEIGFTPGPVLPGNYRFAIGSAGSTTLLVQTLLPALAKASGNSTLVVEGGTHNGMAPSTDFMELAFLPCVRRMGLDVVARLERHGFYPNGGGCWRVEIGSWLPAPLALVERGRPAGETAVVKIANLGTHVAEREIARVRKKLKLRDECCEVVHPAANGPGNIVSVRLEFEHVTEVFESVGALGLSAERVAGRAASEARQYLAHDYPVGTHLADQLVVPMVLGAGGVFRTGELSAHARTNLAVVALFAGEGRFSVMERGGSTEISIVAG